MNTKSKGNVVHVVQPRIDQVYHVGSVAGVVPYKGNRPPYHVPRPAFDGSIDRTTSFSCGEDDFQTNEAIEAVEHESLCDFIEQVEMQLPQWLNAVCSQE